MKITVITVAGISSRFNKDFHEDEKILKCLYYDENPKDTLIYRMIQKTSDLKEKINLVYNDHFDDLSSGYSLYLGIREALTKFSDIEEILFVEGDLDVDMESFQKVIDSPNNVITINHEAIYSNKAVVLYQNGEDKYVYAFNSDHGLLSIDEPFKAIFNSGQIWKFNDMDILKIANDNFKEYLITDTNLGIIQKYFDMTDDSIDVIPFNHWVNCNTREDYQIIKKYWRNNL